MDSTLIDSILSAVQAAPDDVLLRLHLTELLSKADRHHEALEHAACVLVSAPTNLEALRLAANAAEHCQDSRLVAYQELLKALGGLEAGVRVHSSKNTVNKEGFQREVDDLLLAVTPNADAERPSIRMSDVAGMEEVKKRLELAFFAPLRNPELRSLYGKNLRGGLLLYGPPGCGKTFIAKAIAGELGMHFIDVGLSDVLSMWLGESEKHIHDLFVHARQNTPCVIFLDEIDALGHQRTSGGGRAETMVNQLLMELDGVGSDNNRPPAKVI